MEVTPNLLEQPTKVELQEIVNDHVKFVKSLLYLTKKVFML